MNEKKTLLEWLESTKDINIKMQQLLSKAQKSDIQKADGMLDKWLKEQDSELYEKHKEITIIFLALRLNKDKTPLPSEVEIVMSYFVECNKNRKVVPKIIEDFVAKNIGFYLQSKNDKKSITLGQAFSLEKMKGHPKRGNRLTPEVIGITKKILESELELTLAIEAYQAIQMENNLDEETSTETLRTMFHEQKEESLVDFLYNFSVKINKKNISDEARKLVGRYWTDEQDPLKIGTNRKKS